MLAPEIGAPRLISDERWECVARRFDLTYLTSGRDLLSARARIPRRFNELLGFSRTRFYPAGWYRFTCATNFS